MRSAGLDVGLLLGTSDGAAAVPLGSTGQGKAVDLTAETLVMAGVERTDRVVVALNSDGAGVGVLWTLAAATLAHSACPWGPRQPRRLAQLLRATSADVLVTTPTLARQLLVTSRVSGTGLPPLRRLVLVSPAAGLTGSSTAELAACVSEVWCDPVFGVAMASRRPEEASFTATRPGLLHQLPVVDLGSEPDLIEWAVTMPWPPWEDLLIRTGVIGPRWPVLAGPTGTIGEQLLLGDRWLSLSVVTEILSDHGVDRDDWVLEVERTALGEKAELFVKASGTVVGAVQRVLNDSSPVHISVRGITERPRSPGLRDRRGQHHTIPCEMGRTTPIP